MIWHQSEIKCNQKVIDYWVKYFQCKITLISKIYQFISAFINYKINRRCQFNWLRSILTFLPTFDLFPLKTIYFWNDSNLKIKRKERGKEGEKTNGVGLSFLWQVSGEHTPLIRPLIWPHRFYSLSVVPHWGHKAIIQCIFRVHSRSNYSKMKTDYFYLRFPVYFNIKCVLC